MVKKRVVRKTKPVDNADYAGVFIPAGLLVGLGIGIALDTVAAGLLVGLGIGFLLMGFVKSLKK